MINQQLTANIFNDQMLEENIETTNSTNNQPIDYSSQSKSFNNNKKILNEPNSPFVAKEQYNNEYNTNYNIPTIKPLSNSTEIRTKNKLYNTQENIIFILQEFEILEKQLRSFEEVKVLRALKEHFRDKYLLQSIDILEIHQNINELIDISNNPTDIENQKPTIME
jgi:hypothetical protein